MRLFCLIKGKRQPRLLFIVSLWKHSNPNKTLNTWFYNTWSCTFGITSINFWNKFFTFVRASQERLKRQIYLFSKDMRCFHCYLFYSIHNPSVHGDLLSFMHTKLKSLSNKLCSFICILMDDSCSFVRIVLLSWYLARYDFSAFITNIASAICTSNWQNQNVRLNGYYFKLL